MFSIITAISCRLMAKGEADDGWGTLWIFAMIVDFVIVVTILQSILK